MVSRTFPSRASRRGLAAAGWPRGLGLAVGDVTMEGNDGRWTLHGRPFAGGFGRPHRTPRRQHEAPEARSSVPRLRNPRSLLPPHLLRRNGVQ
jgi:hypothetical protein